MNVFIENSMHVHPHTGQLNPFADHFKGAVVLETLDFSVSDLSAVGKNTDIPHGLLQVTVLPAPLQAVCTKLANNDDKLRQFADRIANMLQSVVILMEAFSEKNES
eukprot:s5646_g1.t1